MQQREAARQFYYKWNGKGNEDEDARSYWIDILQDILGVDHVTDRLDFEKKVVGPDGNMKRIDVYIPETHVLIEQKSLNIVLDRPQAGHNGMTPYEQAKMYDNGLPFDEKARWIVISNFAEIWIYDMNQRRPEPVKLALADLQTKYHMLSFLVSKETTTISEEMKISLQAGELVGKLYDAFSKQYRDSNDPETMKSLNKLCVRVVFCLYAEDAAVFGRKGMFHDYMAQFDAAHARVGIRDLFRVLNQKPEERDTYLADDNPLLAAFPYVNGGLFADDDIEIPPFTDEIMELLLRNASEDFDWSGISPTIFGAVFESTLNPETRRNGGMHYTSIENIHKVIDPLFLDDLKAELKEIKAIDVLNTKERRLKAFQNKLTSITILDPAAGSGNFLTESYLCLRRLENEVISELFHGQIVMGAVENPIQVGIGQFYGIEINDFAVTVARTALWIAENQMMKETEDIIHMTLDFLPLKTAAHIEEGNALRLDWNDVVPRVKLTYICGNPPFYGASKMSAAQKAETVEILGKGKRVNSVDYVGGWYYKAAAYIQNTNIHCALVSTNSITQGEQVAALWTKLFDEYHIHIDFAYRTFRWDSEATMMAHVHCVIIGFSVSEIYRKKRIIYADGTELYAENINPYLVNSPNVLVESKGAPICSVPKMTAGNKPSDGGHLILSPEEREEMINYDPSCEPLIRRYVGSKDFINNDEIRYCLWLKDVSPSAYRSNSLIMRRLEAVRAKRLESSAAPTRALADKPYLFFSTPQTDSNYLCIPEVSSEKRIYIPIGFMDKRVIASNKLLIVPDATIYDFGILTSNVHMSWMRAVGGRLEMRYQYSGAVVYNTFVWPEATEEQRSQIEKTAQKILDTRALYPNDSLADLYDPLTMPPALLKAHQANDIAVMKAYGMPIRETDEAACVAWLMRLYQEKTAE